MLKDNTKKQLDNTTLKMRGVKTEERNICIFDNPTRGNGSYQMPHHKTVMLVL